MKNYTKFICCLFTFVFWSCEEVIDVDLDSSEPRLVIDASLNWIKGTAGNIQRIHLSLTAPYFDDSIPPATEAKVWVTDTNNTIYWFNEEANSGIYITENFNPELNEVYTLFIEYKNETYTATTVLKPVVPIEFVEQKNNGGFDGNAIELKAYYNDPAETQDYYLFEFVFAENSKISVEVYDDEFTNGNEIFAFFSDDNLEPGDEIIVRNYGITQRTFEYFNLLLQQTDDQSGDPFQTQPATLRGNCINITNPNNYPLGYFRASETDMYIYTVE